MMKKMYRIDWGAMIFAFLSLISLRLTLFTTNIASNIEAGTVTISGFHLWEFASGGIIVLVAPMIIMIIGTVHTQMQNKYLIMIGVLILALVGYNQGIIEGREWIYSISDGFVRSKGEIVIYPILLMISAFTLMLHMYFTDCINELEMDFTEEENIDFSEEY